ncbi:MarR family transcriptional regulator [Nonomuraea mesophila]|uniref:MarR family transcriptional regulator n=2 Tax=Nonomuraea mesophila TaxID=2530382 RepID=A0A4R5EF57_9ACTN|nr:MarR family transcriptional regulator [Nonomuraea mesophila]
MVLIRRLNVESDRFVEGFAVAHGLHRTDMNALVEIQDAHLAGHALSPGELGGKLNLSAPATTALIDRLEQAGHVVRRRSATDGRKVEVVITERAAELARGFFAPLGRHLTAAVEEFGPGERKTVVRFLTRGIEATVAAREDHGA